jgi:hypothetical protein
MPLSESSVGAEADGSDMKASRVWSTGLPLLQATG